MAGIKCRWDQELPGKLIIELEDVDATIALRLVNCVYYVHIFVRSSYAYK